MSILFEKQRWKLALHYSRSVNNATVPKALSPARMAVRCNHTKAVMADLHSAMKGLPPADESCYLYNSTTTTCSSGTMKNYRNMPLQNIMFLQTLKLQHLLKVPQGQQIQTQHLPHSSNGESADDQADCCFPFTYSFTPSLSIFYTVPIRLMRLALHPPPPAS